jgi:poly-beta-1,6-N-acetyl-D-glucosamine synthase
VLSVAVGLFAYNEEASVERAIRATLRPVRLDLGGGASAEIRRVVLVTCGSTDATEAIARRVAADDARIEIDASPERQGKAAGINRFLARVTEDVLVLVSADVVLSAGALEALLRPFRDASVGMTGARPLPENGASGTGRLLHVLWDLHDLVARDSAKLGEAIAIRAPCAPLPSWTRADEASFEADVTRRRRLRLVYCPEAIVHNRGPTALGDYLEQRTRIAAAHCEIEAEGYTPATRSLTRIARHAAGYLLSHPGRAHWVLLAACIEALARVRGRLRARAAPRRTDGLWASLPSARPPEASSPQASCDVTSQAPPRRAKDEAAPQIAPTPP